MKNAIDVQSERLRATSFTWLITGVAGFIGSNLLEALLRLEQRVVGIDNFSTGHQRNLDAVRIAVSPEQWAKFEFVRGDVRNFDDCLAVVDGVDFILHQAALGSVPRSLADPATTNDVNVNGHLNILLAAKATGVNRIVYAASSSTYGDHPGLPKVEGVIGRPLSPYAVTKYVNELYADVFARNFGMVVIGLRYFNVFGPRQDPDGQYAAVIPKWFKSLLVGEPVYINGDGSTSRDFCYVKNVVQANILAALSKNPQHAIYNVACGARTSLNELYALLQGHVAERYGQQVTNPIYREFRAGDVRHSLADISLIRQDLGYAPTHSLQSGLEEARDFYFHLLGHPQT